MFHGSVWERKGLEIGLGGRTGGGKVAISAEKGEVGIELLHTELFSFFFLRAVQPTRGSRGCRVLSWAAALVRARVQGGSEMGERARTRLCTWSHSRRPPAGPTGNTYPLASGPGPASAPAGRSWRRACTGLAIYPPGEGRQGAQVAYQLRDSGPLGAPGRSPRPPCARLGSTQAQFGASGPGRPHHRPPGGAWGDAVGTRRTRGAHPQKRLLMQKLLSLGQAGLRACREIREMHAKPILHVLNQFYKSSESFPI